VSELNTVKSVFYVLTWVIDEPFVLRFRGHHLVVPYRSTCPSLLDYCYHHGQKDINAALKRT
jgi:hypothetical protein